MKHRITSQPSHFVVHYLPPHIHHCVGGAIPRSVIDHITVELLTACCTGPQPNRLVEVWITYPAILCFLLPGKTFNCTAYRRANGTHRQRWDDFNFWDSPKILDRCLAEKVCNPLCVFVTHKPFAQAHAIMYNARRFAQVTPQLQFYCQHQSSSSSHYCCGTACSSLLRLKTVAFKHYLSVKR